jgi:hypothetical protein
VVAAQALDQSGARLRDDSHRAGQDERHKDGDHGENDETGVHFSDLLIRYERRGAPNLEH